MALFKKFFITFLILSSFNLFIPKMCFPAEDISKNPLEIRSTPEEDMPTVETKKTSGWSYILLLILAGGAAALAGSSGGGGEESGSTDGGGSGSGDTGSVSGTW